MQIYLVKLYTSTYFFCCCYTWTMFFCQECIFGWLEQIISCLVVLFLPQERADSFGPSLRSWMTGPRCPHTHTNTLRRCSVWLSQQMETWMARPGTRRLHHVNKMMLCQALMISEFNSASVFNAMCTPHSALFCTEHASVSLSWQWNHIYVNYKPDYDVLTQCILRFNILTC